jgi:hypothetical protein
MMTLNNLPKGQFVLYAEYARINDLARMGYRIQSLEIFQRYWISRLKPAFLNKATRAKELEEMQVVLISTR